MSEAARIRCVGAILVNPQGKILLQQRDERPIIFPLHWTTFGGRIEDGETPDEAMRRELLEEIELQPVMRLWKVFDNPVETPYQLVVVEQYLYVGEIDRDTTQIRLNEGRAMGFFGLDELSGLPIAFGFEKVFKEFFETYEHGAGDNVPPAR